MSKNKPPQSPTPSASSAPRSHHAHPHAAPAAAKDAHVPARSDFSGAVVQPAEAVAPATEAKDDRLGPPTPRDEVTAPGKPAPAAPTAALAPEVAPVAPTEPVTASTPDRATATDNHDGNTPAPGQGMGPPPGVSAEIEAAKGPLVGTNDHLNAISAVGYAAAFREVRAALGAGYEAAPVTECLARIEYLAICHQEATEIVAEHRAGAAMAHEVDTSDAEPTLGELAAASQVPAETATLELAETATIVLLRANPADDVVAPTAPAAPVTHGEMAANLLPRRAPWPAESLLKP